MLNRDSPRTEVFSVLRATIRQRMSILLNDWTQRRSIIILSRARSHRYVLREIMRGTYHSTHLNALKDPRVCYSPHRESSTESEKVNGDVKVTSVESPNEHYLKFIVNVPVIDQSMGTVEFLDSSTAKKYSPLAAKLFSNEVTRSVLIGPDFITVEKDIKVSWDEISDEYASLIRNFFKEKLTVLDESYERTTRETRTQKCDENEDETVTIIKEIIESRIRPAVQDDGGDIEFVDFKDGVVKVSLKGSCRTCDLSVVTLKDGVERMLKYYVNGVSAVLQDVEEIEGIET